MSPMKIGVVMIACVLLAAGCGADDPEEPTQPEQAVVRVPQDAPDITAAVDQVAPGGLVLVAPGTYQESVTITKAGVTLRGLDRNQVILEGDGKRTNGITVGAASVTVENLTVRNYLLNGVLVTGVLDEHNVGIGRGSDGYEHLDTEKYPPVHGFSVRYVTAVNNGLYGIYAFNRNDGTIADSYASGSADSGIYVGQCESCNIVVTRNVAEHNAVGYENANASGVTIAANRFTDNRVGLTMLSDYQEAYAPQRRSVVVGNLVAGNNEEQSPEQADGGFGVGIGLAGTDGVVVVRNRVEDNQSMGLAVAPTEDLPAVRNRVARNEFAGNRVDVSFASSAQSGGTAANCVRVPGAITSPSPLPGSVTCGSGGLGEAVEALPMVAAPPGIPFLDVPFPPDMPGLPGDLADLPYGPVTEPEEIDVDALGVPPRGYLPDSSRVR